MKRLLIACVIACPSIAAAEVTVIDNGKTQTIDCAKDPEVSLIGNHLTITLTGACMKLKITGNHETVNGSAIAVSVAGNENTLVLAAADEITVAGNSNVVTWKKGVGKPAPSVKNSGKTNKISQAK